MSYCLMGPARLLRVGQVRRGLHNSERFRTTNGLKYFHIDPTSYQERKCLVSSIVFYHNTFHYTFIKTVHN